MSRLRRWLAGRAAVIGIPYAWLVVFFLLPFLVVARISVSEMETTTFKDIVAWKDGALAFSLNFGNYLLLVQDSLYFKTFLSSLKYAAVTTLLCLAIGYPFAYFMARARALAAAGPADAGDAAVLDLVPAARLRLEGAAHRAGPGGRAHRRGRPRPRCSPRSASIPGPGQLMNTPFSLVLGMTYTYLPFMILPLYSNLAKMDLRLLEAASDLGATAWTAFWKITVPLSQAGIVAGAMLVFIPCVGEYVIPELLGGPQTQMIGRTLWDEFFSNNDWPMACAVAVTMVLLVIVPLAVFSRYQAEAQERRT